MLNEIFETEINEYYVDNQSDNLNQNNCKHKYEKCSSKDSFSNDGNEATTGFSEENFLDQYRSNNNENALGMTMRNKSNRP